MSSRLLPRATARLAAGIGLLLPRDYYVRKALIQQTHWRQNVQTLCNVRTIYDINSSKKKEYQEPGKAIIVPARNEDYVVLFDGQVQLAPSSLRGGPYGPYSSPRDSTFRWLTEKGAPEVPLDFRVDARQREKFLQSLGLEENDLVAGKRLYQWYGFYLQRLA